MKYRESAIPNTVRRLRDRLVATLMRAPTRHFEYGEDLDGAYYVLERGVENLRKTFGDRKANQIIDMLRAAKGHHEADDKLGSRLLQDVEMVIANRQPYAYPKELYRWPLNPELPKLSEHDIRNEASEGT